MNLQNEVVEFGKRFNIPDKKLLSWWRSHIRLMWTGSQAYLDFMEKDSVMVENTGRNKGRYPTVKRHQCNICKQWFGTDEFVMECYLAEALEEYADYDDFMIENKKVIIL